MRRHPMTCANCGHGRAAHNEDSVERRSAAAQTVLADAAFPLANCLIYCETPYVPFAERPRQRPSQAGQGRRKWKPYRTPQMIH